MQQVGQYAWIKVSKAGRRLAINEFIEVSQGSLYSAVQTLLEGLNEKSIVSGTQQAHK